MTLVPAGFRGLVFAALIAAIVSSLASMMNSISTIFTMDIYRAFRPARDEHHYVTVGRVTALTAMVTALVLAQPFLGGFESAFQTIQEYTGFIAPGIVATFLLGLFWKRTNTPGAFALLISSVGLSMVFWLLANPAAMGGTGANLLAALGLESLDLPFVIRIWIVFLAALVVGVAVSLVTGKPDPEKPVDLADIRFVTGPVFNIASVVIVLLLALIYVVFW